MLQYCTAPPSLSASQDFVSGQDQIWRSFSQEAQKRFLFSVGVVATGRDRHAAFSEPRRNGRVDFHVKLLRLLSKPMRRRYAA